MKPAESRDKNVNIERLREGEEEDNGIPVVALYVNNIQPSRHQTSFVHPGRLIFGNCRGGLNHGVYTPRGVFHAWAAGARG